MAKIYIIAGPPGIGKSTAGSNFIPEDLNILDPDFIAERYRAKGFADYKEVGHLRFESMVKHELFSGKDFGIELNLGFQNHYNYIASIKNFGNENSIDVVLFYTDDINLCYQRAKIRHEEGLHYVPPETIKEMYENTLPLLGKNIPMVSSLTAIKVTKDDDPVVCMTFDKAARMMRVSKDLPDWAEQSLKVFVQETFPALKVYPIHSSKMEQIQNPKKRKKGKRI